MMRMCGHADPAPPRAGRVLYIAYASPVPSKLGPARRHYHVLEQLARFYNVHFLCVGESSEAEAFARQFGDRVDGFTFAPRSTGLRRRHARKLARTLLGRCDFLPALEPALQQACARVTSTHAFDAIVLSSVLLRSLPLPERVPIVGDTHNVEFDVLRRTAVHADRLLLRQYARRQWPAMQREERRCGESVDLVLATSVRDRQVFERELGLRRVAVVPNGIDLAEFAPSTRAVVPDTILFSGLMSYFPNQQAVRWFLRDVFPTVLRRRPGARLIVAGADPPRWLTALAGPNLEVTGRVPDIRPFVARAAVVVAPLLIGGGTRVKILKRSRWRGRWSAPRSAPKASISCTANPRSSPMTPPDSPTPSCPCSPIRGWPIGSAPVACCTSRRASTGIGSANRRERCWPRRSGSEGGVRTCQPRRCAPPWSNHEHPHRLPAVSGERAVRESTNARAHRATTAANSTGSTSGS